MPKAGQKDALDDWLENELAGVDASVLTQRQQVARVRQKAQQDMLGQDKAHAAEAEALLATWAWAASCIAFPTSFRAVSGSGRLWRGP